MTLPVFLMVPTFAPHLAARGSKCWNRNTSDDCHRATRPSLCRGRRSSVRRARPSTAAVASFRRRVPVDPSSRVQIAMSATRRRGNRVDPVESRALRYAPCIGGVTPAAQIVHSNSQQLRPIARVNGMLRAMAAEFRHSRRQSSWRRIAIQAAGAFAIRSSDAPRPQWIEVECCSLCRVSDVK